MVLITYYYFMDGVYGFAANAISTTVTSPIDVIKTNYQIHRMRQNPLSTAEIVKDIWVKRGVRGFYTGLIPMISTYPIFWTLYFSTNEYLSHKKIFDSGLADKFTKSYICSLVGSSLTNPLFVLKTRVQNNNSTQISLINTIRETNKLGVRGYFKGLPSTLLNNVKLAIQFPLYDYIKDNTGSITLASSSSKIISSTIFYPLDLIRINQRTSNSKDSIINVGRTIYRNHMGLNENHIMNSGLNSSTSSNMNFGKRFMMKLNGVSGLYRGVFLYHLTTTPNFVIMMWIFEYLKNNKFS